MDEISNEERLRRIPMNVASVIGAAERGGSGYGSGNIEELTASLIQLAASYAEVVTTIGMHREPALTLARDLPIKQLDNKIARQMNMGRRMGPMDRIRPLGELVRARARAM